MVFLNIYRRVHSNMKTIGIICEYNPFHSGHAMHIEKTREAFGEECAVVCVMSGNFVQRGDLAVFNKHARAEAAVRCGADLVVEMPSPYALLSAEGYATAGVCILDGLGICDHISFGSESGDVAPLSEAADAIVSAEADALIREWLEKGLSYAAALQKAADAVLGARSDVFKSPNDLLGIEYLKAIAALGSPLRPIAVKRTGGAHDGDTGYSASALRKKLLSDEKPWSLIPRDASEVFKNEIELGRGPVSVKSCEIAILSRLREIKDFSHLPGAVEGLEHRFMRYAAAEPTVEGVLEKIKTKRYAMSRLRRMIMCACLGITAEDTAKPPPYIRVLAMNDTGRRALKDARGKAVLPIIVKPAYSNKLPLRAAEMFRKEAASTDFYVLAYSDEGARAGGQEWRQGAKVVDS